MDPLLAPFVPLLIVFATAIVVFAMEVWSRRPLLWLPAVSAMGLIAAFAVEVTVIPGRPVLFGHLFAFDGASKLASLVVLGVTVAIVVASAQFEKRDPGAADYHSLFAFVALGAMLLAAAGDLLMVFLGIEAMSLPLYALVTYRKNDRRAQEGALKYFLLGAFASATMVFGMSLLIGLAGTSRLAGLGVGLTVVGRHPLVLIAVALTGSGLAFKLGAAPFHFWVMDAYEASTPAVGAALATVPKMAALAVLVRLVAGPGQPGYAWAPAMATLAVLSMVIGSLGGLAQKSVARLLGYSSVAQTGYVLIGLAVATPQSFAAALGYFAVYSIAAAGAFLAVGIAHPADAGELDGLAGLSKRHPAVAVALAMFMLSLVGVPPLAGFFGKFALFSATIAAGYWSRR